MQAKENKLPAWPDSMLPRVPFLAKWMIPLVLKFMKVPHVPLGSFSKSAAPPKPDYTNDEAWASKPNKRVSFCEADLFPVDASGNICRNIFVFSVSICFVIQ